MSLRLLFLIVMIGVMAPAVGAAPARPTESAGLVFDNQDYTVRVMGELAFRHDAQITALAVTPTGDRVLSASRDGSLRLWQRDSGALLQVFEDQQDAIRCLAMAPDSRHAAAGDRAGKVNILDLATGKATGEIASRATAINAIGYSPDGKYLAVAARDKTVTVWNPADGTLLQTLDPHTGVVVSVAFVNATQLLTLAQGDYPKLWDVPSGALVITFQKYRGGETGAIAAAAGNRIVTTCQDNTFKSWNLAKGEAVQSFTGHTGAITALCYSPTGEHVISAAQDGFVHVWDVHTGNIIRSLRGQRGAVQTIAIIPDQPLLLSADAEPRIRFWNWKTGKEIKQDITGHTGAVTTLAFTPDGDTLVSGGADGTLQLWDVNTGRVRPVTGHNGAVHSVAVSPDGRLAISGSQDKTFRLWDIAAAKEVRSYDGNVSWFKVHDAEIVFAAFGAAPGTVLWAGADEMIREWRLQTNEEMFRWGGSIKAVALSADRRRLASGGDKVTLQVWDIQTGDTVREYRGYSVFLTAAALSATGTHAAAATEDNHIFHWKLDDARSTPMHHLKAHAGTIHALLFLSDSRLLSTSADRTLKLWNLDTGELAAEIPHYSQAVPRPVASVAVALAGAPDGQTFAATAGSTICIYHCKQ